MLRIKNAIFIIFLFTISCGFSKSSKKVDVITISTEFGDMQLILFDQTLKHKENFLKLTNEGFYDSTTFHRIIPDFMIQGGSPTSKDNDPRNDGIGGPGYLIDAEFKRSFLHFKGAIAAARTPDSQNPEKKSSGSQFYIVAGLKVPADQLRMLGNQRGWKYTEEEKQKYQTLGGYPWLDMDYTVFGTVINGLDVIDKISDQERDKGNRPIKNIYMKVKVNEMSRKKIQKEYGYIFPEDS
jgi:cyclophilin family peptidyl-prolyl cis-trans isomerase